MLWVMPSVICASAPLSLPAYGATDLSRPPACVERTAHTPSAQDLRPRSATDSARLWRAPRECARWFQDYSWGRLPTNPACRTLRCTTRHDRYLRAMELLEVVDHALNLGRNIAGVGGRSAAGLFRPARGILPANVTPLPAIRRPDRHGIGNLRRHGGPA